LRTRLCSRPISQFLLARFEAADTRLTALLTVVIGVTTAVPVFARTVASTPTLDDVWFIAGLLFALVATGFGIVGRTSGTIRLVNPGVLYETALHLDEWTFKKERVYFAGQHFEQNAAAIASKGGYAAIVSGALVAEVVSFSIWLFA